MGQLNANNSNIDTMDSFDIPNGEYFVGIDYANVKYSDDGGGEYSSYYIIADIMILGSPNENEDSPEISEELNRLVGTKEQLFITVMAKDGRFIKRGFEAAVNMVTCFKLDHNIFNINNPQKLQASFAAMPINIPLGIPLSYAVLKVTRNEDKNGKVWVNKDISRCCTHKEVDVLNNTAPGFVDVKEVFDETPIEKEEPCESDDISEEEIPF